MKIPFSPTAGNRSPLLPLLAAPLLGMALLTLFAGTPARADCQKYFQSTGAVPGTESCMRRCASGRKNLATYACGQACPELCGLAAQDQCEAEVEELQEYVADWERELAEVEPPFFSADQISYLRKIGETVLARLRGVVISRKGAPASLDAVIVNGGHIKRIYTAKTDEEKAAAGVDLYFSFATSLIPRGGSPESAGAKIDEVHREFMKFINAGNDPDAMRSQAEDLYRRQQSPACNGGGSELQTYKP